MTLESVMEGFTTLGLAVVGSVVVELMMLAGAAP